MAYAALSTIQTIASGEVFTAATLQQANDNGEFHIDPPACSVYNSTTQTLTTATLTVITANSENYDNDSMHSTVTNTSRITINTAGRYLFIAELLYVANATGNRVAEFFLNGTTRYKGTTMTGTATNDTNTQAVRSIVCAAGDYVEVRGYQSSGGNLNVTLEEFVGLFLTR